MPDYNFSKYIRHTSSYEAPDSNKLLMAAGWVEASKKLIVALTEVGYLASKLVEELEEPHDSTYELPDLTSLKKALYKLAELDGGSTNTNKQ